MSAVRLVPAAVAVLRHPSLWPTAVVEYRRMVPDGWWRMRPWLPVPDRAMVRFRTTTQYGDPDHGLEPADVVTWLRWCRAENRRR